VSCRVARLSQDYTNMDLVSCCECGSPNPEVFYTLKTLGRTDVRSEPSPRLSVEWRKA
jgi:hypothetical protein